MSQPNFVHQLRSLWQKNWYLLSVIIVLLTATCLRCYQLGQVPHGFAWDEAAIGYNGFAIMTTRRDEWLKKLPVSFRSFGDYKAPLAIYINGIFTWVFGLNVWAVRLPFALAGVLAVAGMILMVRELMVMLGKQREAQHAAVLAGLFMTFSPWHLQFSRAAFESGMALCFVVWAVALFLLWIKQESKKAPVVELSLGVGTALCCIAALYTYHSAKIVVPILFLLLALLQWKKLMQHSKTLIIASLIGVVMLLPMVIDVVYAKGNERFTQASVFGEQLSPPQLVATLASHFATHFTPQYLFLGYTPTLRHGEGRWGVLYPVEFCLVLIAVIDALLQLTKLKKNQDRAILQLVALGVVLVVLGVLPAAIGRDVPHSNRALLALPGFILLEIVGLRQLYYFLHQDWLDQKVTGSKGEKQLLLKASLGIIIFVYFACVCAYLDDYYTQFAKRSAADFEDGYIEAMQIVKQQEPSVDKIVFTNAYGQPYIYALFVRQTNPIYYHGGSLIKYEFPDKVTIGDTQRKNALVVGTPQELDPRTGQYLVKGSDGSIRFVIVKTTQE